MEDTVSWHTHCDEPIILLWAVLALVTKLCIIQIPDVSNEIFYSKPEQQYQPSPIGI